MKTSESRYGRCIYFSSNALARKTEKLARSVWKKVNLSPSHAYLLMIVIDEPGVQAGALSQELQLTPSTITRLLEKLEEKKLVIRTADGKATNVYPTAKSKELKTQLRECVHEFDKSCVALISKEEIGKMVMNVNKISDKIES